MVEQPASSTANEVNPNSLAPVHSPNNRLSLQQSRESMVVEEDEDLTLVIDPQTLSSGPGDGSTPIGDTSPLSLSVFVDGKSIRSSSVSKETGIDELSFEQSNLTETKGDSGQSCHCSCIKEDEDTKHQWNGSGHGLTSKSKSIKKPFYGSRFLAQLGGGDIYDYENIYGDDPMYEELKPNARVWKVYNDEMDKLDSDRVEDWRDGLDALLVLGALFSAVLSTFVVETSSRLDFDWGEVNAHLLVESVALQRAAMSGISPNEVPSSSLTPSSTFHAKPLDVALNVLWFTSLVLSLGTALSAVVAKQWIHQYTAVPTGTPQERAQIRHFRFMGLEKWHMSLIIGLLPMFIHLSVAIFFVGLLLFLHELNLAIAVIVDILTFTILSLYLASNLLPVWYLDCPYKTPLTSLLFPLILKVVQIFGTTPANSDLLENNEPKVGSNVEITHSKQKDLTLLRPLKRSILIVAQMLHHLSMAFSSFLMPQWVVSYQTNDNRNTNYKLNEMEINYVKYDSKGLKTDPSALSWLISSSTNSSAKNIALDALSNLNPDDSIEVQSVLKHKSFHLIDEIQRRMKGARLNKQYVIYSRAARALIHSGNFNLIFDEPQDLYFPVPSSPYSPSFIPRHVYNVKDYKYFIQAVLRSKDHGCTIQHEPILWASWFQLSSARHSNQLAEFDQDIVFEKLLSLAIAHRPTELVQAIESGYVGGYQWPLYECHNRIPWGSQGIESSDAESFRYCLTQPCNIQAFLGKFASEHLYKLLIAYSKYHYGLPLEFYEKDIPTHLQLLDLVVSNDQMWREYPDLVELSLKAMGTYAWSWNNYFGRESPVNIEAEATFILKCLIGCLNSPLLENDQFWRHRASAENECVDALQSNVKISEIFKIFHLVLDSDSGGIFRDIISPQIIAGIVKRCTGVIEQLGHKYQGSYIEVLWRDLCQKILIPLDYSWTDSVWTQLLQSRLPAEVIAYKYMPGFEAALESLSQSNYTLFCEVMEYLSNNGALEKFCAQSLGTWSLKTIRASFLLSRLNAQLGFIIPAEQWQKCISDLSQDNFLFKSWYFDRDIFTVNLPKFATFIQNNCEGLIPGEDDYSFIPRSTGQSSPELVPSILGPTPQGASGKADGTKEGSPISRWKKAHGMVNAWVNALQIFRKKRLEEDIEKLEGEGQSKPCADGNSGGETRRNKALE